MADPLPLAVADAIARRVELVAAARERACETALQSGRCGVLETWDPDGVTFEVTARVPYGHLYVDRRSLDTPG